MAISKRLRFEVFRRDHHACRYCGRSAPEVKLTVDHVTPEALGGTNDPGNLVTACADCNGGKTSIAPDSPLVDDVKQDALRWAQAISVAGEQMLAEHDARQQAYDAFQAEWDGHKYYAPLPDDWKQSVERFTAAGLPLPILVECAGKAMRNQNVRFPDKFRYMCGIAWSRVTDLQEAAGKTVRTTKMPPTRTLYDSECGPVQLPPLTPMQRDMIAVPAFDEGQRDLAESLLENFTDDEVPALIEAGRRLLSRDEIATDEKVLAAQAAMRQLVDDRIGLNNAITDLLDMLPDQRHARFQNVALEEFRDWNVDDFTEYDLHRSIVRHMASDLAVAYLNSLDQSERDEWLAIAYVCVPDTRSQPQRAAALAGRGAKRYASIGTAPHGMCQAPGDNRASCRKRADVDAFYANCIECLSWLDSCRGHPRWCREHLAELLEAKSDIAVVGVERYVDIRQPTTAGGSS